MPGSGQLINTLTTVAEDRVHRRPRDADTKAATRATRKGTDMNDEKSQRRLGRWGAMVGLLAGGAVAGSLLVGSLSANAATSSPGANQEGSNFPAHGAAAHEDAEKAVTGTSATKAQAAAVKSVGGGTAGSVTRDFTGSGYEVTVSKADGSKVEVHLDSSFAVQGAGR